MTEIILILFAIILASYVALPMIFSKQTDPLPNFHNPVLQDLEEERDALLQAILELEYREDLPKVQRDTLRARYEAKATLVLRALDAQEYDLDKSQASHQIKASNRPPLVLISLLVFVVASAASLSSFVLPRVGNSSITTFFDKDLEAGRTIQQLQRVATKQPNNENLLALADAYWQLAELAKAEEIYQRIVNGSLPVPAIAYRRLGFLTLQTNLEDATDLLELSRAVEPADLQTLFTLGELYYTLGRLTKARQAWQEYLVQSGGEGESDVSTRLATLSEIEPLYSTALENPSERNQLILAEALWNHDNELLATEIYFQILAESNPDQPLALKRASQSLVLSGRLQEAIVLLERLQTIDEADAESLLLLGHCYFNLQNLVKAIETWESYLMIAVEAGPVPDLIARAEMILETSSFSGQELYETHCATCHGLYGQGALGPTLSNNPNVEQRTTVLDIIKFGRGLMPGFGLKLSDSDLEKLVDYVINRVAQGITTTP